jgi:antitoxin component of RelBE/YafQ-DinJ toxin-antitoxin module
MDIDTAHSELLMILARTAMTKCLPIDLIMTTDLGNNALYQAEHTIDATHLDLIMDPGVRNSPILSAGRWGDGE